MELRIELELHARSNPADCWHQQLTQRLQQAQTEEQSEEQPQQVEGEQGQLPSLSPALS